MANFKKVHDSINTSKISISAINLLWTIFYWIFYSSSLVAQIWNVLSKDKHHTMLSYWLFLYCCFHISRHWRCLILTITCLVVLLITKQIVAMQATSGANCLIDILLLWIQNFHRFIHDKDAKFTWICSLGPYNINLKGLKDDF